MKLTPGLSILVLCMFLTGPVMAQELKIPETMPVSADDYKNSEKSLISLIDWLNADPVNKETDLRRAAGKYVVTWLTSSPTVNVALDAKVTAFMKQNPPLLINFLGGWAKYALEHDYSKDVVQGNLNGLRSVIKVYKMGGAKRDKDLEKLAAMDEKGELQKWVEERVAAKARF